MIEQPFSFRDCYPIALMEIIGHAAILRELHALAASAEPPHALLLAGPEGTGRAVLAREYARLLNCEAAGSLLADGPAPCGACRPCRLIAEGAHPDVITLGPGDTLCRPRAADTAHASHTISRDIRICQVRGLIELVARYPFEARHRVVIIDPAERLALQSSHAILKTLEEPPPHTYLVLLCASTEAMLDTVLSRCRRIDVRPVPRAEIEAALLARGVAADLADRAAIASHGRPGRALAFAAQPDLLGDRQRLLDRCARLAAAGAAERFRYADDLAERWRRDRLPILAELEAWEGFWAERLHDPADSTPGHDDRRGAIAALQAIARARADLQAQVMVRATLQLMLLCFPRTTLAPSPQEEPVPHA